MNERILQIFQREAAQQCQFGILAANDLNAGLAAHDNQRIFMAVQSLLIAAGNVSKLLWPIRDKYSERGERLRESLGVADTSVLAPPRRIRDHFEHFDERLEDWAASSERHNIVDLCVGPPNMIVGLDPGDFMRNYDTTTNTVTFRGESYAVQPIVTALQQIWARAEAELEAKFRRNPSATIADGGAAE